MISLKNGIVNFRRKRIDHLDDLVNMTMDIKKHPFVFKRSRDDRSCSGNKAPTTNALGSQISKGPAFAQQKRGLELQLTSFSPTDTSPELPRPK